MRRVVSALCAAMMMLPLAVPAEAGVARAPVAAPAPAPAPNAIPVQGMDYSGGGYYPNDYYRYGDGFVRRGDDYYWRGFRGSRHHRPGYRRYGGWWFPAEAFILGAIIGGAIMTQPPAVYPAGRAHVRWCYMRYRSYREWDNSFQPYHGPRRQCVSPYWP